MTQIVVDKSTDNAKADRVVNFTITAEIHSRFGTMA